MSATMYGIKEHSHVQIGIYLCFQILNGYSFKACPDDNAERKTSGNAGHKIFYGVRTFVCSTQFLRFI